MLNRNRRMLEPTVIVALLTLVAGASACRPRCETTILRAVSDALAQRQAVVFRRDCGATTGFNTQVAILARGDETPDATETVFVIDDTTHASGEASILDVDVRWSAGHRLVVTYDPHARVIQQEPASGEVQIEYATRVTR